VVIEFVDSSRSGEFHMTMDPSAAYALTTPPPLTDQERRAKEKQLRQELAVPYRKWLNEDAAYIITDEERTAFVRLQTDAERETFIENFWLRRDPTPGTVENEFKEEHYRRIAYANEHFSTGIPGWKTDMGRIYIMYGPPDAIETFGAHAMVWTYRFIEGIGNDAEFTFEYSPERNGEFRLTKEPAARQIDPAKPVQNAQAASHEEPDFSVNVMLAHLMNGAAPNASAEKKLEQAIATKRAECAALLRKYQPEYPDVLACNNQVHSLEQQRNEAKVVDHIAAEASMAEKANRVAIILVQLGRSKDEWHILGEVTTGSRRVVQSFEQDVSGEPALAKAVLMSPGAYQIKVVAKNKATGAERRKELDFTVD
jgi:GWxTD domain-containing protein